MAHKIRSSSVPKKPVKRTKITFEIEKEIYNYLKAEVPIPEIARKIGISERSVYNVQKKLKDEGYINKIFGRIPNDEILERITEKPLEAPVDKYANLKLSNDGVYHSKDGEEPPSTFGEVHLSGWFYVPVVKEGDFEDIRDQKFEDNPGYVIGHWFSDKGHPNGCEETEGMIRFNGETHTYIYRKGNKGHKSLRFGMDRLWIDPLNYRTWGSIMDLFNTRARIILSILSTHGWKFTDDLMFEGDTHIAFRDRADIGQRISFVARVSDGQIVSDRSLGVWELEIEDVQKEAGLEGAKIYAHIPEHIKTLTAEAIENNTDVSLLKDSVKELRSICLNLATSYNEIKTVLLAQLDNERIKLEIEKLRSERELLESTRKDTIFDKDIERTVSDIKKDADSEAEKKKKEWRNRK